ncbi:MAG: thioredoxin, partial [Akkermansiaceae bacterium]|nr:thioredoxin [Akkermansiaceae bacterium]
MLERLAKKNADKVRIVKVDISEQQEWAVEQNVTGVPTFQIYGGGNKLE